MYEIKNGILHKDGKKIYALGQSYYPSFHHAKYPVPPEGDRMGEMEKDLTAMAEMGFNHVRFAPIGRTELDEKGEVVVDTPFVDKMLEKAHQVGLSAAVRIQGYAVNLRNFDNVLMVGNTGHTQDTSRRHDFGEIGCRLLQFAV